MRILTVPCLLASLLALAAAEARASVPESVAKPNIILILADDLGYSDLGCYGGEIKTPNLDKLAANGLRFTQFYNCARCCPTRASLQTGLYPHQAGVGNMTGDQHKPGYRGHLHEQCLTLAELVKSAGYRAYLAGKWHLDNPGPIQRGYDEAYMLDGGFRVCFDPKMFLRLPQGRPQRTYAPGKFYATDAITDYALDFLGDARQAKKPYFLYLAYNAPHFPLQAPKEEIAKYAEVYQQGWDNIRDQRYERMKKLGLLGPNWPLSPRSEYQTQGRAKQGVNPAWASLDADRRADLARRMAIYAGMVDRMDQNIGRVLDDLRKNKELDNTLIFFLSDNGACAEWDPWGFDIRSGPDNVLHKGADLDRMGGPGSYHSYGSGWANASNTPFRLYKHYGHEGGVSTPLIVHWPARIAAKGELRQQVGHVIDFMPTLAEVSGAKYPQRLGEKAIMPMEGKSLLPALENKPLERELVAWEHEGNKAIRMGNWKLVAKYNSPWELYDLVADRVEGTNLADNYPDRVADMKAKWETWAKRCHVEPWPVKNGPSK